MIEVAAEPSAYAFDPAKMALVVIDMQRDFIEPGGFGEALGNNVGLLKPIIPNVRKAMEGFRSKGMLIVHTREGHRGDLSDCPPAKLARGAPNLRIGDPGPMGRILILGEPGNDIISELAPGRGEIVIDKPGKGAFYNTELDGILKERGISHLAFAGVTTEVCVQTTMREANDRGYECVLLEDCTESYFPAFKTATIEMIRAQGGIVGWTTTSERLLAALAKEPVNAGATATGEDTCMGRSDGSP
jgi:nicotinamidase-related amidase